MACCQPRHPKYVVVVPGDSGRRTFDSRSMADLCAKRLGGTVQSNTPR